VPPHRELFNTASKCINPIAVQRKRWMASNSGIIGLRAQTRVQADQLKSIDFIGEPAYELLIHSDDPHVWNGDNYNTIIEISGAGDVDCAKITLSAPPNLISGDVTYTYRLAADLLPESHKSPLPAFFEVPFIYFTNFNWRINPITGYTTLSNVGEWYNIVGDKREPTLSVSFKIAEKAPKGDHRIFLNMTYKSQFSQTWYTNKQAIDIHVCHWYEDQKLKYLIIVPIIPALFLIWNQVIIPLFAFLDSWGIPANIVEFAKILIIVLIITVILSVFFEHYD
jgi:hypothetical protein